MKRIIAILLTFIMVATCFTGCGKKGTISKRKRQLYSKVALKDYVEVGDYLGIVVDTKSSAFLNYYNSIVEDDVWDHNLYKYFDVENDPDGKESILDGDIVNLDYEGKIDGVAFNGGTATGYNLEIGSGTFIDDFEEELIGAKVGETKDITAVFPSTYHTTELAGKEAVFTCKINYIVRVNTIEDSYQKMGFATLQEYHNDITKRAVKKYIQNTISDKAKIKNYPEKDKTLIGDTLISYVTALYAQDGGSLEMAVAQKGMTVAQYKEEATKAYQFLCKKLDKSITKGVHNKKYVARQKARCAKALNKLA